MNFILPFRVPPAKNAIGYQHNLLCIGSCFASEIGELIKEHQFNVALNPHGILFHSQSIAIALNDYITNRSYTNKDLVMDQNRWHSLHHHGSFSHANKEVCLDQINTNINKAHLSTKNADWLCITLGSSWVYEFIPTGEIVANCHKIPSANFKKKLLEASDQVKLLQAQIDLLRVFNPKINIILTVSPVKYIRDGIIENNISKSHLLIAANEISQNNKNCHYFPAFELVNDVLRDYRFYKEDLVHPNDQAMKFVWEQFIKTYLEPQQSSLFEEVSAWVKFNEHTPKEAHALELHLEIAMSRYNSVVQKINSLQPKY
jgi:hypothetical protein